MNAALNQAIESAGGLAKLAAALVNVQPNQLSNWRTRGVPIEHCAAIEMAAGTVKRWDLRPDDWHRIWPELIGADGAPPVPEPTPDEQGA